MGDERRCDVDLNKIRPKIQRMRTELQRLRKIKQRGEETFLSDPILEAAATRMLQITIEAMVDISNHIIARKGLGIPHTYRDAISLMVDHGILRKEDRETFINMVRFRNRAVHLYDSIEPAEVYRILRDHLPDFNGFIDPIVTRFFRPDPNPRP